MAWINGVTMTSTGPKIAIGEVFGREVLGVD
ncbi:hypothetical protein ENSA5_08800 [Enhygromyxa salina]|uniref:Uncharacterized protein n=1 Tax=Enhygromyxa salina TaxID=215803 RepID=A0A2S9YGT1_9BACT|nr:hypothetical protein ENSA5_08800 [Enhygromyxa salina]